jgi:hypothetical protein
VIHVVTSRWGRHTIHEALATAFWDVRDRFRPWTYEDLHRDPPARMPRGVWLWTDLERLDTARLAWATTVSRGMAQNPWAYRQLNRPGKVLGRLDLLDRLHRTGINDFRAWPLEQVPADVRFPVFLRLENDHQGPRTDLVPDRAALDAERARIRRGTRADARWLVVEFAGSPHPDGRYRKYSAFKVGRTVFPRHLFTGDDWMVKEAGTSLADEVIEEERRFLADDPHRARVQRVFRLARIDYGRIDYDVQPDGRMRVWEINTNPSIMSFSGRLDPRRRSIDVDGGERVRDALLALDRGPHDAGGALHPDLDKYTRALRLTRPTGPPAGADPVDVDRARAALPILERRLRFLRR